MNETEAGLSPVVFDTEDEITQLFLAIKEEAEKERRAELPQAVKPSLKPQVLRRRLMEKPNVLFRYIQQSVRVHAAGPSAVLVT